jgi:hypothetical protein
MSEFIDRKITKEIEDNIFKWKIIIIYWPRQVGKTTLVRALLSKYWNTDDYYNCDEPDIRLSLTNKTSTELRSFFWDKKLIVIDEAQRVENIGITLKLLIDNYPDIQIIATWSSSFDLANKINEPLTWRKYEYHLYPFSIEELNSKYSKLELTRFKDENMIFWLYPEVFFSSQNDKIKNLKILVDSYLYKDILSFWNIRKPDMIIKLLQALALQVWNQVSYTELANLIWVDKNTIENYIIILEKAFIIFRLWSFSRNLRNEIKFSKKIYFYDLWVRNALINNFNPLELRQDTWALWENFLISERIKYNSNNFLYVNSYFWRTFTQQEIDYIEESWDKLSAYEFKYSVNKKPKPLKNFIEAYLKSSFEIINWDNYLDFVM